MKRGSAPELGQEPEALPRGLSRGERRAFDDASAAVNSGCACGTCKLLHKLRASPRFAAALWQWLRGGSAGEEARGCVEA